MPARGISSFKSLMNKMRTQKSKRKCKCQCYRNRWNNKIAIYCQILITQLSIYNFLFYILFLFLSFPCNYNNYVEFYFRNETQVDHQYKKKEKKIFFHLWNLIFQYSYIYKNIYLRKLLLNCKKKKNFL